MVPGTASLKIVRTIPGQSTGTDDDVLIAEDGSTWKRTTGLESASTAPGPTAVLRNGRIER